MLTSTAPTFQARPIQRQRVGAFDAEQFDDKVGQFGIRQFEVVEEPLEPFVVRLFFGVAGKGRRENREIDGLHRVKRVTNLMRALFQGKFSNNVCSSE